MILNHELLNELRRFGSDLNVLAPAALKEMAGSGEGDSPVAEELINITPDL